MIYTVIYSDGKKQIFNNFQRYGNRPIAKGENLAIVSVQGEVEVFIFKKDGLDELPATAVSLDNTPTLSKTCFSHPVNTTLETSINV